jgi:hypothetical protein
MHSDMTQDDCKNIGNIVDTHIGALEKKLAATKRRKLHNLQLESSTEGCWRLEEHQNCDEGNLQKGGSYEITNCRCREEQSEARGMIEVDNRSDNSHKRNRCYTQKYRSQTLKTENILQQFHEERVIGDGNCLFRSLSQCLGCGQQSHEKIRQQVVHYMRTNKEEIECLVDSQYSQHTDKMSKINGGREIWGTEAEIQASASYFGTDIYVYREDNKDHSWSQYVPKTQKLHNFFFVVKYANNHYNPLLPNEGCTSIAGRPLTLQEESDKDTNSATEEEKITEKEQAKTQRGSDESNKLTNQDQPEDKTSSNNILPSQVTNLSDRSLSDHEEKLLSYGLKFVPTRRGVNIARLLSDLGEWERRMRLREYFYKEDEEGSDATVKKQPKTGGNKHWTPLSGRDPNLDLYISTVKEDILSGLKKGYTRNITAEEDHALETLLKDESIVIRPMDKGSGVVVLNTSDYISKIEKDLQENQTYKPLEKDVTKQISTKVRTLLKNMKNTGAITEDMRRQMMPKNPGPGKVKGNPKVHKHNIPIRTIVSSIGHATEGIAEAAENELRKHVESLPSHIQDTTDFINQIGQIPQPLPEKTLMFCMDVKGLYPSIPNKEGMEACEEALRSRKEPLIPTEDVVNMIQTTLSNNNFQFNQKQYKQIEGTAIGSKLGMAYSSTYMGKWEDHLLQRSPEKPLAYNRFVDDIWGLWTHGEEKLHQFQSVANSIHPNIQVDLRYSEQEIEFLDTWTRIQSGYISTAVYTKPTDNHMYLHANSDHPKATKRSVAYGLAIRAKRISTHDEDYQNQRKQIKDQLCRRGHSPNEVEKQLKKVDKIDRKQLLKYRTKEKTNDRVPLVVTYHKALPRIGQIASSRLKILHRSERLKKAFPKPPIVAFKRDTNLEDILVHVKHKNIFSQAQNGTTKCDKKCAVCKYAVESDQVPSTKGLMHKVKCQATCSTPNVVYAIQCDKCKKVMYVGETGRTLYERMQNHLSTIRTKKVEEPVAEHFCQKDHKISDFRFLALQNTPADDTTYRRVQENIWIKKLGTFKPDGLNSKDTHEGCRAGHR